MTCEKCADLQALFDCIPSYIRVGNANVMVIACREHLKQLIDIYTKNLKEKKE